MKKSYKTPALRESKLKALTLLAGSPSTVDPSTGTTTQYSKQNSIFDSVFSPADEDEE